MRVIKIIIQYKCCVLLFFFFICSHFLFAQWTSPSTVTYQTNTQDDVFIGGDSLTGSGLKSFWRYNQAAFRGGELSFFYPNIWDSDSLGLASFAYGMDASATGNRGSISLGVRNRASGLDGCIALGFSAMASGQYGSTAIGNNTRATGNNGSSAIGFNTKASGHQGAMALGAFTTASGNNGATALGQYVESSAESSICLGSGYNILTYLENNIPNSFMIGCRSPLPSIFVASGNATNPGFVGIGTTAPTQPLHIDGALRLGQAITLDPGMIHWDGNHFQGWTGSELKNLDESSVWDETAGVTHYENGNVGIGPGTSSTSHRLHVSGDIALSGLIIYPSDHRLKANIKPVEHALSMIKKLEATSYVHRPKAVRQFGLSTKKQYGFIAQDVKKILPSLVVKEALTDEEGKSYMGMDYKMLIPILVEALKEADDKTDALLMLVQNQAETIKKMECELQTQAKRIDQLMR